MIVELPISIVRAALDQLWEGGFEDCPSFVQLLTCISLMEKLREGMDWFTSDKV